MRGIFIYFAIAFCAAGGKASGTARRRDDASIVPYKYSIGPQRMIYVSPRRDEGIAPYRTFIRWQHMINCSVGNGLDRSGTSCVCHHEIYGKAPYPGRRGRRPLQTSCWFIADFCQAARLGFRRGQVVPPCLPLKGCAQRGGPGFTGVQGGGAGAVLPG